MRAAIVYVAVAFALAGCGAQGADAPTDPAAPQTPPATTAPTDGGSDPAEAAGGSGDVAEVSGVSQATPGEYPLPDNWPADFPVPSGGRFEDNETSIEGAFGFYLYFPEGDTAALLAFIEQNLADTGWQEDASHSNTDQFGYSNENRQYTSGDMYANITVWTPDEPGSNEPFVDVYLAGLE